MSYCGLVNNCSPNRLGWTALTAALFLAEWAFSDKEAVFDRVAPALPELHALSNFSPWFKLDFTIPLCACSGCCPGSPGMDLVRSAVDDPTASTEIALGSSPRFASARASLATTAASLANLLSIVRRNSTFSPLPGSSMAKTGYTDFIVNVGAACGFGGLADPTWAALQEPTTGGLLIDGQTEPTYYRHYPQRANVHLLTGVLSYPDVIVALLSSAEVPKQLSVFKVDIDSFECGILAAVLEAGFRPLIINIEINTAIPPPVRFSMPLNMSEGQEALYNPKVWLMESPAFGCSLSSASDIVLPYAYTLLLVDGWDAFYLRNDAAELFAPIPTSQADAFADGFSSRVGTSAPLECFSFLSKVYNLEIQALVESLVQAQLKNDAAAVAHALDGVRKVLERKISRRGGVNGPPMPYLLATTGVSGDKTTFPEGSGKTIIM